MTAIVVLLPIIYVAGPRPRGQVYTTRLPGVPRLRHLEQYIAAREAGLPVKPGNKAEIIWADPSAKAMTEYAVVYLHGFGASHEEGNPVHKRFAAKYHCNLYLPRLAEHGLEEKEPMQNLTAQKLWESAIEAYAIGRRLGKKVILMSTSTGSTLSLKLAAEFPEINSLILYSPNIEINNDQSWMLNNPWGLQLARRLTGSNYIKAKTHTPEYSKFWYPYYRLEAAVQLQELIENTMIPSTFKKVKQPVLLLYYYKDAEHQDPVVKVEAMLKMFDQLGTSDSLKRKAAIPDAGNHVIGSGLRSKDVAGVERETERFASDILKIKGLH